MDDCTHNQEQNEEQQKQIDILEFRSDGQAVRSKIPQLRSKANYKRGSKELANKKAQITAPLEQQLKRLIARDGGWIARLEGKSVKDVGQETPRS